MSELIGCCSKYNECSDARTCLNSNFKELCLYWSYNLSKGNAIYGNSPGKKSGNIYLIVDDRAFRISAFKKNNSYSMDEVETAGLLDKLNAFCLTYSYESESNSCLITGEPSNPAKYRVLFENNDCTYVVKNYNGYELTHDEATKIKEYLKPYIEAEVADIYTSRAAQQKPKTYNYEFTGRETVIAFPDEKIYQPSNRPNSSSREKNNKTGWVQMTLFDFV